MNRSIYLLVLIMLLCGCFAIVDESSEGRKVKSFVITKDETLDILKQADEKTPEERREIRLFYR